MPKIIDAQSHYMPPEIAKSTAFFKVHWSDIDKQLSVMDEHKIEKSVLLYPTSDAHLVMNGWSEVCRIYNSGIADAVKKHPDRFVGAGIIPIDNPALIPDELKRIEDLGLKMLSLASSYDGRFLDDKLFLGVYDFAAAHNMPVHVHPQIINPVGEARVKDPLLTPVLEYVFDVSMCIGKMMMNEIFKKYSNVNFIFAHYGGVLPVVKERFDNTYLMLRKRNFVKDIGKNPSEYFQNLFYDTSGSRSRASLKGILEVTDSAHVCFASDYPANQAMSDSIKVIDEAELEKNEKAAILGGNMSRLLGLP